MHELLKDGEFQKRLLWFNGLIPLVLLGADLYTGRLGANPPEAIIRTTGVVAILFLVLTLSVTTVQRLLHWHWLARHRRWLGLWSFYYACIHMLSYSLFDKGWDFQEIAADIAKRPFILLGFFGFVLMIPLALTSSNAMIKRLGGKRWKALHRLTYFIAPVVVLHFWLIVKSDLFYPALFALAFGLLLFDRVRRTWLVHPRSAK